MLYADALLSLEKLFKADKLDENLLITDKVKIKGLRHIIVHDYDVIRAADLWMIISKNLPILKKEVEDLITKNNV